jgi:hypothetical protein
MLKSIATAALHALLILALLLESGAWPAQAGALATTQAQTDRMPCEEEMQMPPAPAEGNAPCERGCCPQPACDLSACIATASLPRMERLAASSASAPTRFPWDTRAMPPPRIDALLRPPIA